MKAIVCELCGSNEVIKQNGVYVCQHCGTKYDPEEAKKLMVEVTIDNSAKIQNLYKLARRAYEESNYEDAANYYQQIAMEIPNDWESNFFKVLCKQRCCMVKDLPYALTAVYNNIGSTVPLILIDENASKAEIEERITTVAVESMNFAASAKLAAGGFLRQDFNASGNNRYSDYAKKFYSDVERYYCLLMIKTAEIRLPEMPKAKAEAYEVTIEECREMRNSPQKFPSPFSNEEIQEFLAKAREVDPDYKIPGPVQKQTQTQKSSGCYVATAVYGSYDCPQVWTLRRYRDYTLAETLLGRLFILLYYTISPTLVKWFGETQWFKNMWKPRLDKMVKRLNEQGVADTPYQDRQW